MTSSETVSKHYGRAGLLQQISAGIERLGKKPDDVSIEDLAPVDEFHIGGAQATGSFFEGVALTADDHVLDIGCGLGGASRFAAHTFGSRVTGVDLTREFVEVGNVLCSWVGLEDRVALVHGNALGTGFGSATFDKAFMLHVGMNIPDKKALVAEAWRVLRPGGVFGIYDVMQVGDGALTFPVPWAADAESSWVAPVQAYKEAMEEVGFVVTQERDRGGFALEFFERLSEARAAAGGPGPLGLHLLMGEETPVKIENMIENIRRSLIAPVELIAEKPD